MADYIVSARKYRPASFATVVGQKSLTKTLKNAITSGKLAHAYLFCGPRGVGKTTTARIFAKAINCEHLTPEGEACGECQSCKSFQEGWSYNMFELDAASHNGVDDIRELMGQIASPPQIGKYKVFIIDEVHMLSNAAFNAFLKTLEEPPSHAIFILATTERQKILPTILSRCQTYDFQRITVMDIVEQLQRIAQSENVQYEVQGLQTIARKADGGMRDALSIFDQIVAFTSGNVTYQAVIQNLNILDYEEFFMVTNDALGGNLPAALIRLDGVIRRGFDPQHFIGGWASHLRDLMVSQDPLTAQLIEAGQDVAMRYQQQAAQINPAQLHQALQVANQCDFDYRNSRNKRLAVEIAIIKICHILGPQVQQQQPQPIMQAQPAMQQPQPMPQPVQQQTRPTVQQPQQMPQQQARPAVQQPQPMPQQAPAPQQVQRQVMGRGATNMLRTTPSIHSISIPGMPNMPAVGMPQQQLAQQASAMQPQAIQNAEIDPSALRRCWKEYTQTIPAEKLLIAMMLDTSIELEMKGNKPVCKITVKDKMQQDKINASRLAILTYLQANLNNNSLDIQFEVAEQQMARKAFTPREKLQEMMNQNTELQNLIDTFGLELG